MSGRVDDRPRLEERLSRYVNWGGSGRASLLLSVVPGAPAYRRNAPKIRKAHRAATGSDGPGGCTRVVIEVRSYQSRNPHVLRMARLLEDRLSEDLLGAWVHGSLATGEEVAYSDFDALVILRDEVFGSDRRLARVGRTLGRARAVMFDCDPLQHHGWFVVAECQLEDFPGHYFPSGLFPYARSIFPHGLSRLTLRVDPGWERRARALEGLSRSVVRATREGGRPRNLYDLKSLLSCFMLLPTYYVQLRDREDVFKKHSFDRARADFEPEGWRAMDTASRIRREWPRIPPGPQRWLLGRPEALVRRAARRLAPPVPPRLVSQLTEEFYEGAAELARRLAAPAGSFRSGSESA